MAETNTAANQAEPVAAVADDGTIPPERVSELQSTVELVDVRTDEEYAAGHIAGARHIPLEQLQEAAAELDRGRRLVLYCRTGDRSGMAAEAFRASGWDAVSMEGGLVAWAEAGLPLEPDGGTVADRKHLPGY
jgi:rhodanese-related sulfurtransferase